MNYGAVLFSVTATAVSKHAEYQGPGPSEWNKAITNVINYASVYAKMARQSG